MTLKNRGNVKEDSQKAWLKTEVWKKKKEENTRTEKGGMMMRDEAWEKEKELRVLRMTRALNIMQSGEGD